MSFCKHQSNHCIDVHHPCLKREFIKKFRTSVIILIHLENTLYAIQDRYISFFKWFKVILQPFGIRVYRGHMLGVGTHNYTLICEITFSVIGKFGTSEIEGIDEEKRKSTSGTSGENVWSKFLPLWSSFWCGEEGLDLVLEGKVQSLCWEVSDAVSKIS